MFPTMTHVAIPQRLCWKQWLNMISSIYTIILSLYTLIFLSLDILLTSCSDPTLRTLVKFSDFKRIEGGRVVSKKPRTKYCTWSLARDLSHGYSGWLKLVTFWSWGITCWTLKRNVLWSNEINLYLIYHYCIYISTFDAYTMIDRSNYDYHSASRCTT